MIDQMSDFEKLKAAINTLRNAGVVRFDMRALSERPAGPLAQFLDSYSEQLGMHGIGCAWREIDSSTARRIVQRVLHRDLAYDWELMPQADAAKLSSGVTDMFGHKSRFFTNGDWDQGMKPTKSEQVMKGASWGPATDAAFDTGVAFVDEFRIGLIWVEDEHGV